MRLRIDLAYDGAGFHGWARQIGLRTVQGELERALDLVLRRKDHQLTVAGRTDTGVHARGQVAHLDVDPDLVTAAAGRSTAPPLDALTRRLNGVLDDDVRVHRATEAPPGFDARFSATWRRYAYRIADRPELVDPLRRGHVLAWPRPLDLDRMNRAAAQLLGEHDFAAFCRKREGATTIRTLLDLRWDRAEDGLAVATVRADAFCHNMVRALVGCMIAVGEGRREPGWAGEVLRAGVRDSGVTVVQAHGLTLEEVGYPRDEELAEQARRARVLRVPTADHKRGERMSRMGYEAAPDRYDTMEYRFTGRSGLQLPAISLGLWQNFGTDRSEETQRAILRRAFDRGVTHFDLANNYGPPYGRAEENFGRYLKDDFAAYRDELVISTKAGWDMWPGPYGQGGGSRKYVLASLDQSLRRMGLEYVDIFYSHRFDPDTPVAETMMALDHAVRSGKALYAGISSYSPSKTDEAAAIARDLGTPLLIHQPSYSMFNRWIEEELLDVLEAQGMGCIVFTALAQGLLTDRYLDGVPEDSRAAREDSTVAGLDDDVLRRVRALNEIAARRGQKLAQLALQWALRDRRVTSAVIGASSVEQLNTNLDALSGPPLTDEELAEIDSHAVESGVNLWAKQTEE